MKPNKAGTPSRLKHLAHHQRRRTDTRIKDARWNGEPCEARRVRVIVGEPQQQTWWCAHLVGAEREAVEIRQHGHTWYIDNEGGDGWAKVTLGKGSPRWGHRSLPVARVLSGSKQGRKDRP